MELAILKLQLQRRADVPAAWQISPGRPTISASTQYTYKHKGAELQSRT